MQSNPENPISIDDLAKQIVVLREKPLLVIYYPCDGIIGACDHELISNKLEHIEEKIKDLDVLIHSYGGHCDGAYQIGKAICEYTEQSTSLVPIHAISGGTMIALHANKILFGACARLSALDPISIGTKKNDKHRIEYDDIEKYKELLWLNRYIGFVSETKNMIEKECECETKVEDTLLKALVENVGAENIGYCRRAMDLPTSYCRSTLLRMHPDDYNMRNDIACTLVYELPSHSFVVDYDSADSFGIICEKMPFTLSKITKQYVKALDDSYDDVKPFVEYYPLN